MVDIVSSSRYKINRKLVKQFVTEALDERGINQSHSINIIFVGKTKSKQLAQKYKQEDTALPVLTFIYNERLEGKKYLGEIFICYPHAVIMAAQKGKRVDDIILKLVAHGLKIIFDNM